MNKELLISDTAHFRIDYEINPYMHVGTKPDPAAAVAEHKAIVATHRAEGRDIEYLPPAPDWPAGDRTRYDRTCQGRRRGPMYRTDLQPSGSGMRMTSSGIDSINVVMQP
ncbi:MAG TPA: hypothetical protein VFX60_06275 [Micromonospora sp.]|nr:hypothetical protein [Micromonospora sp.]